MMLRSIRARSLALVAALALIGGPPAVHPAFAVVPQTIVIDGINDFDPSNLVEDDTGDTEIKDWCTGDGGAFEGPMDLGQIFVTNDLTFLYVGFYYDKDCFTSPQVNLGMAIDVNGAPGGTTDPFGRKIGWTTVANKPDLVVYDVLDGFNFEALYQWQGSSWSNIGSTINPGYGAGSNGLGIVENTGFVEFRLPLSALGSPAPATPIRLEWWMTQDGATKGPLDAAFSDGIQMSTPSATTFDTPTVIEMQGYHTYLIQNAVDNTPPTVASATGLGFAVLANKQFALTTNKIDVVFSEPVEATTSQNIANYALTNAGAVTVSGAVRDPSAQNVVHLTLSGNIAAQANPILVTATGVKDPSNNQIVANGTTNQAGFYLQNVTFRNNTAVGFCQTIFTVADSFWVEGNASPLTFGGRDNARMIDPDTDRIYTVTVPFSLPRNPNTDSGSLDLQFKFYRSNAPIPPGTGPNDYEGGDNRLFTLSSADGATRILDGFWNNDDPLDFTTQPMDVVFNLNATAKGAGPGNVITLLGSENPLSFTQPGLTMNPVTPGVYTNYTRTVRFPTCTRKNVRWKVDYDGVIECTDQGDRSFTLNEAESDIVGGTLGPLVLPARGIEYCTQIDKAVAVTFSVDMFVIDPDLAPTADVELNTFSPPSAVTSMLDDGVAPDASTDQIFTRTVVFAQGSDRIVTYKFSLDDILECFGFGDRSFGIDDVNHTVGNPQLRPLALWDYCSDNLVDAPGGTPGRGTLALYQNTPNPAPRGATTIAFDLARPGRAVLAIYDVAGRRVATLVDDALKAGKHQVSWDGLDASGRTAPAGIYFYDLAQDGVRTAKRMVVLGR